MKKYILIYITLIMMAFNACKSQKANQSGVKEVVLENTRWKLTTLDGEKIKTPRGGKEIFISLSNKRLEGYAGCNGIGGEYTVNEGTLKFSGVISTKMACSKLDTENKFVAALEKTESYSIKGNILSLKTSDDSSLNFEAVK